MQRRAHPELPIFEIADGARRVFYAPGHVTVASPRALEPAAREAVRRWSDYATHPFAPESLIVYLSNRCNLACSYCFAAVVTPSVSEGPGGAGGAIRLPQRTALPPRPLAHARGDSRPVSIDAVRVAAERVARTCASAKRPFQLVAHGGGEPTTEWSLLERIVDVTSDVAAAAAVSWDGYLATNGVLSEAKMRRLVAWFGTIGLSCDGPPEIHDRQRPRARGGPSSAFVERMARVVAGSASKLEVRATITPASMTRQVEIAEYLCDVLGARSLRFEPEYVAMWSAAVVPPLSRAPAWPAHSIFAEHFLAAQRAASQRGASLTLSGVRLPEFHGPHCSVLKDALHLIGGDLIAGCFFLADDVAAERAPSLLLGRVENGELILDEERIAAHRACATRIPEACRDCMNVLHCARDCPESCMVVNETPTVGGFRCRLQQSVAERWVLDLGGALPRAPLDLVRERLAAAPPRIDVDAIVAQAAALGAHLLDERAALPKPIWGRRGFEDLGGDATAKLAERARAAARTPLSVYVHIPYCDRRCAFCDCYSVPLGRASREKQEAYVRALAAELTAWSRWGALAGRAVTTIHFGGGTPNSFDDDLFAGFLADCCEHFDITSETEWALESTSTLLGDAQLDRLCALGFRRLHVGVQTLEADVRRRIGRRESPAAVRAKLQAALRRGFITSVDVVYGLPGQTIAGLADTLDRLVDIGIHGVSLYQLQRSPRNERFMARHAELPRAPLDAYLMLQCAEQLLRRRGFRKTHFTHFARAEDANLYYGHTVRGEDLVALGASADGVIGGYHYRHAMLDDYVARAAIDLSLEGGVDESPRERALRPVENALMAADFEQHAVPAACLDDWRGRALVAGDGRLTLTANGSWLITSMLARLYADG